MKEKLIKFFSVGLIEPKHVNFKGTVNGSDYFWRGFRMIPAILIGWATLYLGTEIFYGLDAAELLFGLAGGLYLLGAGILGVALSVSTSIKRFRAVFPNWEPWAVWCVLFALSIVANATMVDPTLAALFGAANLAFSIYVLAKDTDIKHQEIKNQ